MKRIHYFDLLRCTCFCFIIFYHLLFQLYLSGICPVERLGSLTVEYQEKYLQVL